MIRTPSFGVGVDEFSATSSGRLGVAPSSKVLPLSAASAADCEAAALTPSIGGRRGRLRRQSSASQIGIRTGGGASDARRRLRWASNPGRKSDERVALSRSVDLGKDVVGLFQIGFWIDFIIDGVEVFRRAERQFRLGVRCFPWARRQSDRLAVGASMRTATWRIGESEGACRRLRSGADAERRVLAGLGGDRDDQPEPKAPGSDRRACPA